MPNVDQSQPGERGEGQRLNHGRTLRQQEKSAAIHLIGQHSRDGRKKKSRHLARKSDGTEPPRRVCEAKDKPTDGRLLHPGTDQRDDLPEEKKTKIPLAQCAQDDTRPASGGIHSQRKSVVFSGALSSWKIP